MYANVATAQSNQGMSIVDFGFYDPRSLQAAVRVSRGSNKVSSVIDAHLSRRIIMTQEAAIQLAQQLNRLFTENRDTKEPQSESVMVDTLPNEVQGSSDDQDRNLLGSPNSRFRFPWLKKKQ